MSNYGPYKTTEQLERTNAHPMDFLSRRERARLGQDIIDITGRGPYEGGCLVLATAMARKAGGKVTTLRSYEGAEHAALDFHGMIVDFEGCGTTRNMLSNFRGWQGLDVNARLVDHAGERTEGDFPNAPYSEEMVQAVMSKLPENLGERLNEAAHKVGFQSDGIAPAPGMIKSMLDRFRARKGQAVESLDGSRPGRTPAP